MLTYDQVCEFAAKAGFSTVVYYNHLDHQALAELIKLVAESCAKQCDTAGEALYALPEQSNLGATQTCARVIRSTFVN